MNAKPRRKTWAESMEGGVEFSLANSSGNEKDMGPIVRAAFENGKPEILLQQLGSIVKKKEAEIEELCKLHYEEFIVSVDELRGVLIDADELKNMLTGENLRLQEVASSLLLNLDELLELYSIRKNIMKAIQTGKICMQVLNLCLKCNKEISEGKFYPALNTLELIEKNYLHAIPIEVLKKVIERKIPTIKLHIEKKVRAEFNDWLVQIRSKERDIGQTAIGQAASARQREEEMRVRQKEAEEQSRSGVMDFVYMLDTEQIDEDLILEFEVAPLYRAHHVHKCLGIEDQFHDYYRKNRLLQLNLDLQVPSAQPFLEFHQSFFAQIAGFFIVEDRVLRTAGGLLSETLVETLWNTAAAKMTAILEDQFSHMDTASHFLLVKDFLTLLGVTLKRHRYQVAPLLEVLDNNRDKYHELLLDECRKQMFDVLANDKFEQMVVKKENDYNTSILAFHLQASDLMPAFPYVAPFSASVPDACRIIRSFIEDSISYLSYGGHMNIYEMVKQYLDKLLINVLNEGLLKVIHSDTLGVSQVMQIAANISVFDRACDFFLWQAAQLCGFPVRLVERPHSGLTAKTVLKVSQSSAYNALLNLVNSKLDEFMALMNNINWTADDPPQDGNDYILEAIIYLDSVISSAQQVLPLDALYKVASGALQHISDSIVVAFLNENVKRFNLNAVMGIDIDLKKLEEFADERFHSTGLIDLKKEVSLRDCLVEARQLINLLLSNQPENFMNPITREKTYGALDHKKVASICEKFKDSPDRLFGNLSNKNAMQNARKKSMDMLKRRLRDFT